MKALFKLAWKTMIHSRSRTVFTLLCVVLSVSIIGVVLGISDSFLANADFGGNDITENAVRLLCYGLSAVSCVMSSLTVLTAFSISVQDRIKSYGFLSSVGMSGRQKAALILSEAGIYAAFGVGPGTLFGFGIARSFYRSVAEMIYEKQGIVAGDFVFSWSSVVLSVLLGTLTVFAASFFPVLKMKKLSVAEIIKDNSQINISLRQTLLSKLTEKMFGRIGLLAGQNYDNNKGRYRAISLALSGGTVFFTVLFCFFRYPLWYFSYDRNQIPDTWWYLSKTSAVLAAYFVIVFLICSLGSIRQNMDSRKREFAVYRSIGMRVSELRNMMCIESLFFAWNAILFGLAGSLAGDYSLCVFYRVTGVPDLKFHFPFEVFCAFVILDFSVGLGFAVYTGFRAGRINIAETMRGD
ncbi:MAG: ABC transporter permease [Clostridia bacterium]|nr:ABC transporter permease [Clostridia bacterium]